MYSFHFSLAKLLSHVPGVHCLKVGCTAANSAKAESSLHKPCLLPARESLQAPAPERKKIACQKEEEHQIFVKYQVYLQTTSVGVFNDNLRPSSKKPDLQCMESWEQWAEQHRACTKMKSNSHIHHKYTLSQLFIAYSYLILPICINFPIPKLSPP